MTEYNPLNWHWIVAGDESRFWSSAAGAYVDSLPEGVLATRIASEAELDEVLRAYGIAGPGGPAPYIISKDAIWRRATDDEAEIMEAALAAQPIRIRRIYEGATHISSDDELFGLLKLALTELFGAARAGDLLAPSGP